MGIRADLIAEADAAERADRMRRCLDLLRKNGVNTAGYTMREWIDGKVVETPIPSAKP